jgi:hypothetical protein
MGSVPNRNQSRKNVRDEEKRDRVRKLLANPKNHAKSVRELARLAGVARTVAASVRQEMFPDPNKIGKSVRGGYVMGEKGEAMKVEEPTIANLTGQNEISALWESFRYALSEVQNQFANMNGFHPETMLTRLAHLSTLMRLILILESPRIAAKFPPIPAV